MKHFKAEMFYKPDRTVNYIENSELATGKVIEGNE